MSTKRGSSPKSLDDISERILRELKTHFVEVGLSSSALSNGYVGLQISPLKERFCANGDVSQVDFDLSLKELESGGFVKTGPMVPHENPPDSMLVIIGHYSKREFVYLTETGYRVLAQMKDARTPQPSPSQIHISGGNFHQSQIALGEQITQQQSIENLNDVEVIQRLMQLLSESGATIDTASKEDVTALVAAAQKGHLNEAKPIFQKLFGFATEAVKQTAWGILTALLAKAMGL